MHTLRSRLFFSISILFIASAVLNTLTSGIWIRKELSTGGGKITEYMDHAQGQARQFASFLLMFRIIEEATDLERIAQMVTVAVFPPLNLWQQAAEIITYDANIAFVQVEDPQGNSVMISPKDATIFPFAWAAGPKGSLYITFPHREGTFLAMPAQVENEAIYWVFENTQQPPSDQLFTPVEIPSSSYDWQDPAPRLFNSLLLAQNMWLQKIFFIRALLPWQEKSPPQRPIAILKIPAQQGNAPIPGQCPGGCLFAEDAFSKLPILKITSSEASQTVPFLLLRNTPEGKDLDMVKASLGNVSSSNRIALGFSLSALLQEVAILIDKTIVATGDNLLIGFTSDGTSFNPQELQFPLDRVQGKETFISWQNEEYSVSTIDLELLSLLVLTPKEESLSMTRFLNGLSEKISLKISLSLIIAGLLSLLIALIVLHKIAGKITGPIAILSKASQELSKGTYEGLVFPQLEERKDEVASLARSFNGMVRALQDRDKIRGILNKVVSKEISDAILQQDIELEGEERIVTILFSDIRNFTHLAEDVPPHTLINILNAYMTRMCKIIDATHGVVDKFVGDAIMTLYGAPVHLEDHPKKAVNAALQMLQELRSWNEERKRSNLLTFEIGIGIHTGLVYTGNMGAENRLNYTAIGANVNEASRLCSIAKPMQILISQEIYNAPGIQDTFVCNKLDPVMLKGIDHPVPIYEVLSKK